MRPIVAPVGRVRWTGLIARRPDLGMVQAMKDGLARLNAEGNATIDD